MCPEAQIKAVGRSSLQGRAPGTRGRTCRRVKPQGARHLLLLLHVCWQRRLSAGDREHCGVACQLAVLPVRAPLGPCRLDLGPCLAVCLGVWTARPVFFHTGLQRAHRAVERGVPPPASRQGGGLRRRHHQLCSRQGSHQVCIPNNSGRQGSHQVCIPTNSGWQGSHQVCIPPPTLAGRAATRCVSPPTLAGRQACTGDGGRPAVLNTHGAGWLEGRQPEGRVAQRAAPPTPAGRGGGSPSSAWRRRWGVGRGGEQCSTEVARTAIFRADRGQGSERAPPQTLAGSQAGSRATVGRRRADMHAVDPTQAGRSREVAVIGICAAATAV